MLVISRKKNETIVLGNEIEVTVVEIRGDKVRLGIKTPSDVPVHRQEVYEAIKRHAAGPLWTDRTVEAIVEREPRTLATLPPVAASPATLTISGAAVAQLDELRSSAELSREQALETMLQVIDRAEVNSLCDLERRLLHG
jgi:carbon storage regulator